MARRTKKIFKEGRKLRSCAEDKKKDARRTGRTTSVFFRSLTKQITILYLLYLEEVELNGSLPSKHRHQHLNFSTLLIHLTNLTFKIGEVDEKSGKVKVLVSMFGRETPVELDFLQVKKV